MPASGLAELELKLRELSHSDEAIQAVREFSGTLSNLNSRIQVFNATGAIVRSPLLSSDAKALGFDTEEDDFTILQGDVVMTESAYHMGERITDSPRYTVLNSSCDLVPNRREYAALLRVAPIRQSEPDVKQILGLLLKFKRCNAMYLPPLPKDPSDVVCNVIQFDGICQIRLADLLLANRIASLSLTGWRIFASFGRMVLARAGERESRMRSCIEEMPKQEALDLG